jgi:hypothetical protein
MWINIVYWILFKIFQSVNIGQLLEFQKSITRKNKFPAYELLYLLFSINYHSVEISEIKNIYEKFKGEKNIWVLRTMSFFIQMYMNNHDINYKIRQQLVELLWLDKKFISNSIRNN